MALPALEITESLGERAYETIRDAIAAQLLAPGARITERGLAAEMHISPTPVREALRRLEQEGLIARRGTRGIYVAQMPRAALSEMIYLQAVLRGAAARFAAQKLSASQRDELRELLRQMQAAALADDPERTYEYSQRFHDLINAASGNEMLIGVLGTIGTFEQSHRIAAMHAGIEQHPEHLQRSYDEHRAIALALADRDAEQAEALMRAHTLRASERLAVMLAASI